MATAGAGALTFGGAVLPAAAAETPDEPVALNASVDKYEAAAAYAGETAEGIKKLEAQGLINVSDQGFFYYKDEAHSAHGLAPLNLPAAPEGAAIPGNPTDGSRPGAPVTVYLDFDGETLENKQWNAYSGIDSLKFAAAPSVDAAAVWAAVAEDYAPFNVNVTTTRPSDDALYKTSADDNEYGSHVIITDSYDDVLPAAAGSGGIAWAPGTGSEFLSGALVFTEGTENSAKVIAEIASHESGHNFGLGHDGIDGSETGEYYLPTEGVWGTIMGAGYVVPVTQWSAGAYAGATNDEDDLAVITDRGAATTVFLGATTSDGEPFEGGQVCVETGDPNNPQPGDVFYPVVDGECAAEPLTLHFTYTDRADFAADQVGDTAADAKALDNADGSFKAVDVIERTSDVDVFAVTTAGGELTATVAVADISPNLDAKLTVTDASGAVLGEDDPAVERESDSAASGLGAKVTVADVEAGTYYFAIEGVGAGDPTTATPDNANGYTDYGSLGNYTLTGAAEPLVTEAIVIVSPEDGAAVTGGADVDVTGTATPNATVVLTIGGETVATVTADENGEWAATVTANEYGNTEIVASQSLDGIEIAGTDSVTVTAPAAPIDAPVITVPADGTTTEDSTPTVTGTGTAGATVTVTVTDADGNEVATENVVVPESGIWSFDLATELANGDYTVVAVQSLDGVTSDESAAVAFTVAVPGGTGNNNDGDDDNGDNLATTGGDFNAAPFAAAAAALLLVGGGFAAFARRKSLSLDS